MKESIKIRKNKLMPTIKISMIFVGIFVPMLILWLYGGEINLNKENWLVGEQGKKWGELKDGTIGYGINSDSAIIQWMPFVIAIGIIAAITVIFLFLVKFKLLEINFYSILFATWFMLFTVILTGLLSKSPLNNDDIWKIFVRLICIVISFPLAFFILNLIMIRIVLYSNSAVEYAKMIIHDEQVSQSYIKTDITDIKPKLKNKKVTEIEVDE